VEKQVSDTPINNIFLHNWKEFTLLECGLIVCVSFQFIPFSQVCSASANSNIDGSLTSDNPIGIISDFDIDSSFMIFLRFCQMAHSFPLPATNTIQSQVTSHHQTSNLNQHLSSLSEIYKRTPISGLVSTVQLTCLIVFELFLYKPILPNSFQHNPQGTCVVEPSSSFQPVCLPSSLLPVLALNPQLSPRSRTLPAVSVPLLILLCTVARYQETKRGHLTRSTTHTNKQP
jgi:hypothetical protein